MPVILNQPLPDGHPLKNGLVIFGQKRPSSSAKQSTNNEAKPSSSQAVEPEVAAFNAYERAISRLPNDTVPPGMEQLQSLESTIQNNLEQALPGSPTKQD